MEMVAPAGPMYQAGKEYIRRITTKKMPISDQEFLTNPKSPLKKSFLRWQDKALANTW